MPPPVRVEEDADRFRQLHAKYQFGGLVLFNGHKDYTPQILSDLQRISDTPLLVASDIERGTGQQMEGATLFPHAMACGRAGDEAVATFARVTAQEALACGIHITFAPVADVNSNPRNPIIGIRAFGTQSDAVSRHVATFIETCKEEGLLTTAKHFPGHGDTETDSHAEMPVVTNSLEAFSKTERPPFQKAIATSSDLIMTAHLAFPALDPLERPATLSPVILQKLLREELGFKGAIVSDSLIMKAIQPTDGNMARYAANLLNAGLDILLDPLDPVKMVKGIIQAVETGLLSEQRLDEAISRIQVLRKTLSDRFGATIFEDPARTQPANIVGSPQNLQSARRVAGQAIEITRGASTFGHTKSGLPKLAVFITPYKTRLDPTRAPIEAALETHIDQLTYAEVDATSDDETLNHIKQIASEVAEVLAIVVSKPAAWHKYGLPDRLSEFVSQLTTSNKTTLVSLGDPHVLERYPNAVCTICTYSDVPASQQALVQFLLNHA